MILFASIWSNKKSCWIDQPINASSCRTVEHKRCSNDSHDSHFTISNLRRLWNFTRKTSRSVRMHKSSGNVRWIIINAMRFGVSHSRLCFDQRVCVVIVAKVVLCLAQVVLSYSVLNSSKISQISPFVLTINQSYTSAQLAVQTARWSYLCS